MASKPYAASTISVSTASPARRARPTWISSSSFTRHSKNSAITRSKSSGELIVRILSRRIAHDGGPWCKIPEGKPGAGIVIKDAIADITLQQVLTRPEEFDVIATLNLNGDYLSDALAAQVGGIGIAPGGNINYISGHAIFEATHGTAPKYANQDKVNPGSVILSGVMMFEYLGWQEVADLITRGLDQAIAAKTVTYDFARLMQGAKEIKCSEFAGEMIKHMG